MAWKPAYVTEEQVKSYVSIPNDVPDTLDDAEIALAIEAASRAVDDFTFRQYGKVSAPEQRFYTARYSSTRGRQVVAIDDLMTTASMVIEIDTAGDGTYSTSVAVADCLMLQLNAVAKGEPWTELVLPTSVSAPYTEGAVRITATWGWTAVPVTIEQVTLLQVNRLLKRRKSPFGVIESPQGGEQMRLLAKVDPDFEVHLRPYRRLAWGA